MENSPESQRPLDDLSQSLFNTIPDPFIVVSEDGEYLEVLGGTERSLYDDGKPLKGRNIFDFMPEEFALFFMKQVRYTLNINALNTFDYQLQTEQVDLPNKNGPGGTQWFEARMYPLSKPYQGKRAVTVMLINITERRNLHKMLRDLSYRDPLTGLYNRRYFVERVSVHLKEKQSIHIMICDIDHFKLVNDTYGHLAGDAVLRQVSVIMIDELKHNGAIARFGGDEFIIALTDLSDQEAFLLGERLRKRIAEHPFPYQDQLLSMHISVGIAFMHQDTLDAETLIADADLALYQAKEAGRNQVRMYSPAQRSC